jgi:hypothetical protein
MMIFTLEALQAKHGDALLLHYGEAGAEKLIVIDGGPAGVFPTLKERLEQLKARRAPDGALPVRLLMVSHIDDDHINGVLDLTDHLQEEKDAGRPLPYDITTLWHNAFDDVISSSGASSTASVAEVLSASGGDPAAVPATLEGQLMVASVPQGRRLRKNAEALGLNLNKPFNGLVSFPTNRNPVSLGAGLTFIVVGPDGDRIAALKEEWDAKVAKMSPKALAAEAAAYVDKSVFNLSSIVVLAELGGKRMLLTGDARGDFILQGLRAAGLLDADGKIHVDLLKVMHHGSEHNTEEDFFRRVTADHYVISADGKHHNPDTAMLQMLTTARDGASYTIHLTNSVPHADQFLDADSPRRGYKVVRRADDAPSVRLDLLDPFTD